MNFEDYETLPTNNVATHMTAGAIAGVMEHCVMYPLDSVKTRMQSLAPATDRIGMSETFVRMVKQEGILRPVRGMSAMVAGAGPAHALYFSCYEYLKDNLMQRTASAYHTLVYGLSGCVATLLHDGVMNPAEVVKQRLQMYNSPYATISQCLRSVYHGEGLAAFYRSYTTQLTMNVPFQSIHFMVYECMQKVANRDGQYNPAAHMFSGGMAGATAAAITTPLDVCKTVLNTQQGARAGGMLEAIRTIYRLKGPTGFFRGIQARVLYQMPATAICWSTYEFMKYALRHGTRLVPQGATTVRAEEAAAATTTGEPGATGRKPASEGVVVANLPVISGAGVYGAIALNTIHTAEPAALSCTRRVANDAFREITHT